MRLFNDTVKILFPLNKHQTGNHKLFKDVRMYKQRYVFILDYEITYYKGKDKKKKKERNEIG